MANIVSQQTFQLRRAQADMHQNVTELKQALGSLQEAFRPLALQGERLRARLDRAMRRRQIEEVAQRDLQHSFEQAMTAAGLAELEAARDAYVELMAKHKRRQAARDAL